MDIKELRKGTDYSLSFSVLNPDGSPKDLSGTLNLELNILKYPWDTESITLTTEVVITDPSSGSVTISLNKSFIDSLEYRLYYLELSHTNALSQNLSIPMYIISII